MITYKPILSKITAVCIVLLCMFANTTFSQQRRFTAKIVNKNNYLNTRLDTTKDVSKMPDNKCNDVSITKSSMPSLQQVVYLNPKSKAITWTETTSKTRSKTSSGGFFQKETGSDAPLADCTNDVDCDGLKDAEEAMLGTNPQNPDTDGDELPDGWEVRGYKGIDLKAMGASPLHKDIFVHMDWMERATATNELGPNEEVLRGIITVFQNAPVTNPDQRGGINIHLVQGNKIDYDADLNPWKKEFLALKLKSFDKNREPIFRYMMWANGYNGKDSSGISWDIPHSWFIVSLGLWNEKKGGTNAEKIGTFIHELGHNLGLHHGGSDDVNNKPNHLSVMSYLFQTSGIKHNGVYEYDYQRFQMPRLLKNNLIEADGICKMINLQGYYTKFLHPDKDETTIEVNCDGAIDWNNNGTFDVEPVNVDLNKSGDFDAAIELAATPNEWEMLNFEGATIGKTGSISGIIQEAVKQNKNPPSPELTEEQNKRLSTDQ